MRQTAASRANDSQDRALDAALHERDRQLVGLADDSLGDEATVPGPAAAVDVSRLVWNGAGSAAAGGAVGFGVRAACRALLLVVDAWGGAASAFAAGVVWAVWLGRVVGVSGVLGVVDVVKVGGSGWWIAIGLSQAGQFLGRRRAGRGARALLAGRLARCGGTVDAARELAEPWGRGALARRGSGARAARTSGRPGYLDRVRLAEQNARLRWRTAPRIPLRPDWPSSLATSTSLWAPVRAVCWMLERWISGAGSCGPVTARRR